MNDEKVATATGTYDLAELRRKLEERMEYSKVTSLPHDPAMDPDETVPSYASSTEVREREALMKQNAGFSGRGAADSSDDD